MTGPSDRWIMHGQRSNQCMGRLIGLTRPTAIVINKEARIQCFYRMSVVNCSRLYKSSLNYSKIQLHRNFLKKSNFQWQRKREYRLNRLQDELILSLSYHIKWDKIHAFSFHKCLNWQEMTISCKAKGRESNDSKNNRMWYRIILLNKFIFFLLYSGIYMYKICFLFKTMTSRFKSSSYILMFTTQPIPPPKKKNPF